MDKAEEEAKFAEAEKRAKAHPGGDNLKLIRSSERAKELQKKSTEARRRNKERIQTLKEFWKDFDKAGLTLADEDGLDRIRGLDVMRFLMKKAFHDEDFELAGLYAEKIAQYETPKLAAQQVVTANIDLKDLSDEEFQVELARLEVSSKKNTE